MYLSCFTKQPPAGKLRRSDSIVFLLPYVSPFYLQHSSVSEWETKCSYGKGLILRCYWSLLRHSYVWLRSIITEMLTPYEPACGFTSAKFKAEFQKVMADHEGNLYHILKSMFMDLQPCDVAFLLCFIFHVVLWLLFYYVMNYFSECTAITGMMKPFGPGSSIIFHFKAFRDW